MHAAGFIGGDGRPDTPAAEVLTEDERQVIGTVVRAEPLLLARGTGGGQCGLEPARGGAAPLALAPGACHDSKVPSNDAKWIIGTLGGLLVVIGGLLLAQNAGLGAQNAAIRAEIAELRTDFRRLDDRVRALEIALGKVEQRLETLERVMLPAADPADQDEQE